MMKLGLSSPLLPEPTKGPSAEPALAVDASLPPLGLLPDDK